MKQTMTKILLGVSGMLLLIVGAAILLQPHAFFATSGITLGNDPDLLSEIRAPGGLLIGCAMVILLGVFRQSIRQNALILSAIVYGSYGASRMLSMMFDGLPSTSLIAAAAMEITIGALCILTLARITSR